MGSTAEIGGKHDEFLKDAACSIEGGTEERGKVRNGGNFKTCMIKRLSRHTRVSSVSSNDIGHSLSKIGKMDISSNACMLLLVATAIRRLKLLKWESN